MKCINCGRENSDYSNFCFYCGYALREIKPDFDAKDRDKVIINEEDEEVFEGNPAFGSIPIPKKVRQTTDGQPGKKMSGIEKAFGWIIYFVLMLIPFTMPIWLVATIVLAFSSEVTGVGKYIARVLLVLVLVAMAAFFAYTAMEMV